MVDPIQTLRNQTELNYTAMPCLFPWSMSVNDKLFNMNTGNSKNDVFFFF